MPRARRPGPGPSSEIWEVAVVPSPAQVDKPVLGVGLAVDRESGQVRWASPVSALSEVVTELKAIARKHGLPAALCYEDPELADAMDQLSEALDRPAQRQPCPVLERAERALLSAMAGGMPAAGVALKVDAWRRIVTRLLELAPWRKLGECTWFRFQGMGLDGAVAVLMGERGEVWGLALYPTEQALIDFLTALEHGGPLRGSSLSVQFERGPELTASDRALCRSLDLVFTEERVPRLLSLVEGAVRAPTRAEQRLLLAAVEGVTTLCSRDLDALAAGQSRQLQMIATGGQRLLVSASPASLPAALQETRPDEPHPEDLPTMIEADHTVLFGSMAVGSEGHAHPSVVVKLRKRDALKLAQACTWIASLALQRRGAGLQLVACDEQGARGTLIKLWGGGLDELGAHLTSAGTLYLAISSGGPTRPEIRSADFVFAKVLPVARSR